MSRRHLPAVVRFSHAGFRKPHTEPFQQVPTVSASLLLPPRRSETKCSDETTLSRSRMFQVAVLPPRPEYSTRGTGGGMLLQFSHPNVPISTGSNDPSRWPGRQGFQRVTLLLQLRRRSRHSSTLSSRLNNLSRRSIRCVIRIMGRSFHHIFYTRSHRCTCLSAHKAEGS